MLEWFGINIRKKAKYKQKLIDRAPIMPYNELHTKGYMEVVFLYPFAVFLPFVKNGA